ncbi:LCP family protein [Paenibacillus paeoniae]|uniref:LytR family transcriptional regulator n=1 Tax=Paenibacillus paeoniae TaxID=2292705 RepID=A0A371PN80_9BACL|nr:LCP family protein [Paenibacillus paeoniae]REK77631.1 LytR family transcriptional regulator [Paenibacillus paeoniae]
MMQQRKRNKTMGKKKKMIIRLMIILMSVIALSTAVFIYQLKSNLDNMILPGTNSTTAHQSGDGTEIDEAHSKTNEDFYTLVIGLDYRGNHNALLTDTLMVLHVIPKESIVKMLSIPRDLLVENKRGNTVKINSLFSEGYSLYRQKAKEDPSILTGDIVQMGSIKLDKAVLSGSMATTRNKIEEILEIDIDHMVLANFTTVTSLVDEIGGIEIDVKRSMKYRPTNLYLNPGLQVLNGEDALGYARFREDDRGNRYYASDFERGQHQQEVVKALAEKILSWGNITKAHKLLNIVSDNVKTDINYTDMFAMITKYYDKFNGDSFKTLSFPEYYSPEGDVIIPEEALKKLQTDFHAIKDVEVIESEIDTDQSVDMN